MTETISIIFQPLGSLFGKEYYHETLTYTNSSGVTQYATAYPSNTPTNSNLVSALSGVVTAAQNANSGSQGGGYGVIESTIGPVSSLNQQQFAKLFATNGSANDQQIVAQGADLSSQWNQIQNTYLNIGQEGIPYSPVTQNSNSTATPLYKMRAMPCQTIRGLATARRGGPG